jgi:hypothetical protein
MGWKTLLLAVADEGLERGGPGEAVAQVVEAALRPAKGGLDEDDQGEESQGIGKQREE